MSPASASTRWPAGKEPRAVRTGAPALPGSGQVVARTSRRSSLTTTVSTGTLWSRSATRLRVASPSSLSVVARERYGTDRRDRETAVHRSSGTVSGPAVSRSQASGPASGRALLDRAEDLRRSLLLDRGGGVLRPDGFDELPAPGRQLGLVGLQAALRHQDAEVRALVSVVAGTVDA